MHHIDKHVSHRMNIGDDSFVDCGFRANTRLQSQHMNRKIIPVHQVTRDCDGKFHTRGFDQQELRILRVLPSNKDARHGRESDHILCFINSSSTSCKLRVLHLVQLPTQQLGLQESVVFQAHRSNNYAS
jgi:hypothetical protein